MHQPRRTLGRLALAALALVSSGLHATLSITQQPGSVVATTGTSASFTVTAAGTGTLNYQWRRSGMPISGANVRTLTVPQADSGDAGFYDVVVTNGTDRVVSQGVQLSVQPAAMSDCYRIDQSFAPLVEDYGGAVVTLAVASDGRIYAGGSFTTIAGVRRWNLARFNADLTVDAGFAPAFDGDVTSLCLQSDGRLLVAGRFTHIGGTVRRGVARLLADGSVDPTFAPGAGPNSTIKSLLLQPDARILAGGALNSFNNQTCAGLVRLNADGSVDTAFTAALPTGAGVETLARQSDGKVLVGGSFGAGGAGVGNRVARLNADGTGDAMFVPGAGFDGVVRSLALQADGRIVAGGTFTTFAGTTVNRIARLTASGALDTTFSAGTGFSGEVTAVRIGPGGRIAAAGSYSLFNGADHHYFTVLTSTGALDATYATLPSNACRALATNGAGELLLGGEFSWIDQLASGLARFATDGLLAAVATGDIRSAGIINTALPLADGKWMVAGMFSFVNNVPRRAVVRFNADGTVDESFNAEDLGPGAAQALVLLPDGKLVVAAVSYAYGHFVRLNADGTRDATFNTGSGFSWPPSRLALLADGRIAASGMFTSYNGEACPGFVVLRTDGSRDPGFTIGTGANGSIQSLVALADGHLAVAGYFTQWNGATTGPIVRLAADGAADATLGYAIPNGSVTAAALQGDGKIVIVGDFTWCGPNFCPKRARINADFSFDPTYGDLTSAHGAYQPIIDSPASLGLLPDGRAWVNIGSNAPHVKRLARLDGYGWEDGADTFDLSTRPTGIFAGDDGRVLLVGASGHRGNLPYSGVVMMKSDPSPMPKITSSSGYWDVLPGGTVTLAITATGEGPLTYVWIHENGIPIAGATGTTYTVGPELTGVAGTYLPFLVQVKNTHGEALVMMGVNVVAAPEIEIQPADVSINLGQSTALNVVVTRIIPTETYQWYRGESGDTSEAVTGATTATLALDAPTAWGRYWVQVFAGPTSTNSRTALVQVIGGTVTFPDWTLLPGTPANQRGALDTPAGDGVGNLVKFVLGVAPMASPDIRLPRAVIVAGSGTNRHLALEFVRNPLAVGYTLALETSPDLRTWTEVPATLESVALVGDGEQVRLRETAPLGGALRRFVRLVTTLAP